MPDGGSPGRQKAEGDVAFENRTKVLLILPQDILDRARVLAGEATTTLKLSVSVQIVLRALIEEGLKRGNNGALLTNIERQVHAVRHIRKLARQGARAAGDNQDQGSGGQRPAKRRT